MHLISVLVAGMLAGLRVQFHNLLRISNWCVLYEPFTNTRNETK